MIDYTTSTSGQQIATTIVSDDPFLTDIIGSRRSFGNVLLQWNTSRCADFRLYEFRCFLECVQIWFSMRYLKGTFTYNRVKLKFRQTMNMPLASRYYFHSKYTALCKRLAPWEYSHFTIINWVCKRSSEPYERMNQYGSHSKQIDIPPTPKTRCLCNRHQRSDIIDQRRLKHYRP